MPFVVVFAFGACFFLDDSCGGDTMFGLLPVAFAAVFFSGPHYEAVCNGSVYCCVLVLFNEITHHRKEIFTAGLINKKLKSLFLLR